MTGMKKKLLALLMIVSIAVVGLAGCGGNKEYPSNDINGYVAWGAGGATDIVARTLSIYAAEELGVDIVIQNKTGASGAIATEFVKKQKADGYTLLFNAENPTLYKVMDISQVDYNDFTPVILISQQTPVIVVAPDSPYQSISDLVEAAKANPGTIKLGTTGAGALPANVAAMLESTSGITFNQVPFGGDADALTAVMGKHADVSVINYSVAVDYAKEGTVRILTVLNNERLANEPDVECISEVYPEYHDYFPWGAFVGVFVNNECSDDVKEKLTTAFSAAWNKDEFQTYLKDNDIIPLGHTGEDAVAYINKWQQVTTWLLQDAGQAVVSPEEFGIERLS